MKVAVAFVALVALLGAARAQQTKSFDSPQAALDSTTGNPNAPCLDLFKSFILNSNASKDFEDYKGKKLTIFAPSDAAFEAAGLNATAVQTLATTEEGMKILGYHQVAGAGLTAEAIKRLSEVNSAKGRSMATTLCEGKPGCPNVVVVKAGAPTGNTRKMLQATASPSPSPAVEAAGVSPSPAMAATTEVSPSPAMAATTEVSPSPAMAATTEVSPSPAMAATTEVSPSPAMAATTEVSPSPAMAATTEVSPSPAVAATTEVSPSPAMAATTEVSPAAAAAAEVSPAPVDAGAATALPGVSPEVPLDTGAAAMPGTSPEPTAAAEPAKVCAPGTPTGITVNDGLNNKPANVIFPDLASGEVIIHVIDRVLLPPGTTMAAVNKAIAAADAAAAAEAAVSPSPVALEPLAAPGATPAAPAPPPKSSAAGVAVSVAAALAPAVLLAML